MPFLPQMFSRVFHRVFFFSLMLVTSKKVVFLNLLFGFRRTLFRSALVVRTYLQTICRKRHRSFWLRSRCRCRRGFVFSSSFRRIFPRVSLVYTYLQMISRKFHRGLVSYRDFFSFVCVGGGRVLATLLCVFFKKSSLDSLRFFRFS